MTGPLLSLVLLTLSQPASSLWADPQEPPFEGEATLEVCLTRQGAGRHSACRPVLEPEIALAPDGLFNTANATPPARLEGWLGAVCAPDRLAPGQTADACREEAQNRLERSRAARIALRGGGNGLWPADLTPGPGPDRRYGSLRASVEAERERRRAAGEDVGAEIEPTDRTGGYRDGDAGDRDNCRRRESSWRDEDTGEGEASYSIRCAWGSGDPETRRRAQDALDAVMGRD